MRRSGPTWLANLALATTSIGLGFFVVEAFARHLERRPQPAARRLALMMENPAGSGSYRLRPNLDVTTHVQGKRIRIRTNTHGMRWREGYRVKDPSVERVAFLGDSFAFGCWADSIGDSFVGVFDQALGPDREALNFGVGGYGLDDMSLQLEEVVAAFRPDYVIVAMFNGNDWRDTYLGLHKHRVVDGTVELDQENMRRKLPQADLERQPFALPRASDPWQLRRLLTRLATFRLAFGAAGRENPWLEFRPSPYFTSFSYWCQYPYPEVARRARRVTLATLDRLREQSARIGARLAVACIPAREQVYSIEASGSYFDVSRPQVFAREWAAQHGVPFLDLLPVLREQASVSHAPLFLGSDIHLNTLGHRIVGEQLVDWFRGFAGRERAGGDKGEATK